MPILDPEDNHVALAPKIRRAFDAYCETAERFPGEVLDEIVAAFLATRLATAPAPQHLAQELLTAVHRNADITIRIRPLDIVTRGRPYTRAGVRSGTMRHVDAKSAIQIDIHAETLNNGKRTHVCAAQTPEGTARAIADALTTLNTESET